MCGHQKCNNGIQSKVYFHYTLGQQDMSYSIYNICEVGLLAEKMLIHLLYFIETPRMYSFLQSQQST